MSRAASAFALAISLLSTGAVIAHNCHEGAQTPVVHMEHEPSTHYEAGSAGSNLLKDICFGVIFFALLFGVSTSCSAAERETSTDCWVSGINLLTIYAP